MQAVEERHHAQENQQAVALFVNFFQRGKGLIFVIQLGVNSCHPPDGEAFPVSLFPRRFPILCASTRPCLRLRRSRELIAAFESSGSFQVKTYYASPEALG